MSKGRDQARPARTVGDLAPAPYNPRKIGQDADARLARSMERFGDLSGVVFNRRSGLLIGGHQRVRHLPPDARISIGERVEAPDEQGTVAVGWIDVAGKRWIYREVDVDAATERAMNIAANKHGGEWDTPKLAELLGELSVEGFDLELTGWGGEELDELLQMSPSKEEGGAGAEPEPEPDAPEISRIGDVWRLGEHVLHVADSRIPPPAAADAFLVVFDPPFDLDYHEWALPEGAHVLAVWGRGQERVKWAADVAIPAGYMMHELVLTGGVRGQAIPSAPCLVHDSVHMWRRRWWGEAGAKAIDPEVIRRIDWQRTADDRPHSHNPHCGGGPTGLMSWGKPVVAMEVIAAYAPKGALVYDPCAGSGSSLIACEHHGRRWIGCEYLPKWADLIVTRWQRENGGNAVLEGDGRMFDEVAIERVGAAPERKRKSAAARGYGPAHERRRTELLAREPNCRLCAEQGLHTPAREMDHIDGDARNNDPSNLRPLCKPCHDRRTYRDQAFGRKRATRTSATRAAADA